MHASYRALRQNEIALNAKIETSGSFPINPQTLTKSIFCLFVYNREGSGWDLRVPLAAPALARHMGPLHGICSTKQQFLFWNPITCGISRLES